jgi:hypothetical protein
MGVARGEMERRRIANGGLEADWICGAPATFVVDDEYTFEEPDEEPDIYLCARHAQIWNHVGTPFRGLSRERQIEILGPRAVRISCQSSEVQPSHGQAATPQATKA